MLHQRGLCDERWKASCPLTAVLRLKFLPHPAVIKTTISPNCFLSGPMRVLILVILPLLVALPVQAQDVPAAPPAADVAAAPDRAWRDTTGYRFPAIAKTVADMQNLAYAMTLRDYCADVRVPDDFVRERLARFSRMTGRDESCQTLLDY